MRLQHLCDAVIALEAVAEDSSVVKLAPDPARYAILVPPCPSCINTLTEDLHH